MKNFSKFEVWVPTRYRLQYCERMLKTLKDAGSCSELLRIVFIVDYGEKHEASTLGHLGDNLGLEVDVVDNRYKSSLTKLWNRAIIESETDWVFHSGDDSIFLRGWYETLLEHIDKGEKDQIHMLHYGGFAMHKSMVLKVGWFDERFRGGGFEDVDYGLRVQEAGMSDRVGDTGDPWQTWIVHGRHDMNTHEHGHWQGYGNELWYMKKWSKPDCHEFRTPYTRSEDEIDWYPLHTQEYEQRFGIKSRLDEINQLPRVPFGGRL